MTKLSSIIQRFKLSDRWLALSLIVIGLLARLPYFMQIPYFEDETAEALVALKVYPGGQFVSYGVVNYIGPVYTYLVALGYALTGFNPAVPRLLVVVMGAFTVGFTYILARILGLGKFGSFIAALIVLTSPHHILINSHVAWSNSMIGFFTAALLITLALAIKRQQPKWLLAAGVLAGLSLQAHPVVIIMLPGIVLWFLIEPQGRKFMRTRWPYLGLLLALIAYSIVIVHNLQASLSGVAEAQSRLYIWQINPTPATYVDNFGRLMLQLFRVASGQLDGPESFSVLIGLPLIYVAWLFIGVVYAVRARLKLPPIVVGAMILIMPYFSNHYGTIITTRLTNHFTPLIAIMMAGAGEALIRWIQQRRSRFTSTSGRARTWRAIVAIALIAAAIYPIVPLVNYYQARIADGKTNDEFFVLNDQIKSIDNGSTVYLSGSLADLRLGGSGNVGYVFDFLLGLDQIPRETLPAAQILERLVTQPQRALLILNLHDVNLLGQYIPLMPQLFAAAQARGYGLYVVEANAVLKKPEFVFALDSALPQPPQHMINANFENKIDLWGFDLAANTFHPGDVVQVNVYWRARQPMQYIYTGFAHLLGGINPASGNPVWAQDDHELGRGLYRTIVWRAGEVIEEQYTLTIPADAPAGTYSIEVGAYDPVQTRLKVFDAANTAADDKVILGEVKVAK